MASTDLKSGCGLRLMDDSHLEDAWAALAILGGMGVVWKGRGENEGGNESEGRETKRETLIMKLVAVDGLNCKL